MSERTSRGRVLRVELHPLGPRVYVLGVRVHEWQLGLAVLALLAGLAASDVLTKGIGAYLVAFAGVWMIAKDWRDLTGQGRDRGAWRLGLHRPPRPLRPARRGDWVAPASALLVLFTACANLLSTLTPNVSWRGHLLRTLAPVQTAAVFHALALPASAALLVAAFYLHRRRRRAWELAFGLLVALGVINLLKGLDFEEAALSWLAAGILWWGRPSFNVRPHRIPVGSSLLGAGAVAAGTLLLSAAAAASAAPGTPGAGLVLRSAVDMVLWQDPPIPLGDEMGLVPEAVGVISLIGLLAGAWLLFRPLPAPTDLPAREERLQARALVRTYGRDTLAFFKLRHDKSYLFSADARAFLAYRVENRVMVVSGDPVGDPASIPGLIVEAIDHAELHDLRFAAVGASEETRRVYAQAGLHALYIGDEAIVDTGAFSLEGRAIRKVRQSVHRVERAGFVIEAVELAQADDELLAELEHVSALWRGGAAERGFSMALDRIGGPGQEDTVLVIARDAEGAVAGFIHFVPSYGLAAMSLTSMRRRPDTPNGLMEALIVRSVALLRERGVRQVSLNFAAFGRYLREPQGPLEQALAHVLGVADRWFQIERLYRFNAKFAPQWQPRYLIYQSTSSLPRSALAVLWLEGQAPKPSPPWRWSAQRRPRTSAHAR